MFEQQLTNAQNCEGIQMAMPNSFKPAKGNQTLLQEKLVLEGPNKGQESWSKPSIGGLHRFPFSSSFWKVQAMPSMPLARLLILDTEGLMSLEAMIFWKTDG